MSQFFDKDYKNFDFEIIKEDWNDYELSDGTMIRGRLALTRIIRRNSTPPNQYEIIGNPLFISVTEPKRRKPTTPPLTQEESLLLNDLGPNKLKQHVDVSSTIERWNQYRINTTDEVLRVKMILIDIFRIDEKYDEMGEPVYWFSTGNVVAPLPSKESNRLTP